MPLFILWACGVAMLPLSRAQFATCEEAVQALDDRAPFSLELEGGEFTSFSLLAVARPALISLAHPDWVGVYSAAVSLISISVLVVFFYSPKSLRFSMQSAIPGVPVLDLRVITGLSQALRWMQVARESADFLSGIIVHGFIDGAIEVREFFQ